MAKTAEKRTTRPLRHLDDCPEEGREESKRVETYLEKQPSGQLLEVQHCVECGATEYTRLGDAPSEGGA